jgi:hypothetical protein
MWFKAVRKRRVAGHKYEALANGSYDLTNARLTITETGAYILYDMRDGSTLWVPVSVGAAVVEPDKVA